MRKGIFKKNKVFQRLGLCQIALLVAVSLAFAVTPSNIYATADNQVVIQLKAGQNLSSINQSYGTSTAQQLDGANTYLLNPAAGQTADSLVSQLQTDSRLIYSESNYSASRMKSNPSGIFYDPSGIFYDPSGIFYDQSINALRTTSTPRQYAYDHIRLNLAHQVSKGAGITIAVVDSGIYVNHPMLAGHLTTQRYNALTKGTDVTDVSGHGTFIAGILAQVAPQAKIMPVKVLGDTGYGEVADAADGIRWAADNGAKIINVSMGTYYDEPALLSAVAYAHDVKGALVVASVGNDNSSNRRYPASYAGEKVLAVGASNINRQKASFSNYGDKAAIRVVAPGTQLRSLSNNGGFVSGQGTSFSTPIVAGVAALYWSTQPTKKTDDVKKRIEDSATELKDCDITYGATLQKGLIDSYEAVGGHAREGSLKEAFFCKGQGATANVQSVE